MTRGIFRQTKQFARKHSQTGNVLIRLTVTLLQVILQGAGVEFDYLAGRYSMCFVRHPSRLDRRLRLCARP